MKKRKRFCPGATTLEDRALLSHAADIAPLTPAPLDLSGRSHTALIQSAADSVNQIFDSFTADYLQTQGAYFASTNNSPGLFHSYIIQRLNLMSQQLVKTFTHVPGSLNMLPGAGPGGSTALQIFLRRYINGPTPTSLATALAGTGGHNPIPPSNTTGTTATLYTTQALAAIETARAATLNSVSFLINHTFRAGHR